MWLNEESRVEEAMQTAILIIVILILLALFYILWRVEELAYVLREFILAHNQKMQEESQED